MSSEGTATSLRRLLRSQNLKEAESKYPFRFRFRLAVCKRGGGVSKGVRWRESARNVLRILAVCTKPPFLCQRHGKEHKMFQSRPKVCSSIQCAQKYPKYRSTRNFDREGKRVILCHTSKTAGTVFFSTSRINLTTAWTGRNLATSYKHIC